MPDSRMLHNRNRPHPFPELGQASGNIHWNYDALIRAPKKEPVSVRLMPLSEKRPHYKS